MRMFLYLSIKNNPKILIHAECVLAWRCIICGVELLQNGPLFRKLPEFLQFSAGSACKVLVKRKVEQEEWHARMRNQPLQMLPQSGVNVFLTGNCRRACSLFLRVHIILVLELVAKQTRLVFGDKRAPICLIFLPKDLQGWEGAIYPRGSARAPSYTHIWLDRDKQAWR